MASFDLYPTVEMEGPGGRVVVNDCDMDKAAWRERGYKEIPGTKKGALMTVVEQAGTLDKPGEILNAIGEPALKLTSDGDDEKEPEETPSAPTTIAETKSETKADKQPASKGKGK